MDTSSGEKLRVGKKEDSDGTAGPNSDRGIWQTRPHNLNQLFFMIIDSRAFG
jgi:hypothetical protein